MCKEVKLNSEEILPKEKRIAVTLWNDNITILTKHSYIQENGQQYFNSDLLIKYQLALEAAELEIIQLKQDADERYNLALLQLLPNLGTTEHKEICVKNGLYQEDNLLKALKIAAYGTDS